MTTQTLSITFFESADKSHPAQTTRSEEFSVDVETPNTDNLSKEKQDFIQAFVRQHARKAAYDKVTWAQKRKLSVDVNIHNTHSDKRATQKACSGYSLLENPDNLTNQRQWQELNFSEAIRERIDTLKRNADYLKIVGSSGLPISFVGAILGGGLLYGLVSDSAGNYALAAMGVLFVLSVTLSLISVCVEASASRVERNARETAPALPPVSISKVSLLSNDTVVTAVPVNPHQVEPTKIA